MQQTTRILIHHLNYQLPDSQALINDLSLAIAQRKTGLVGRNGIGKSTLIKLITGELCSTSGNIQVDGKLAYVPQNPDAHPNITLAEFLGFAEKLSAFERITHGSIDENDFTILNEEWDIQDRFTQILSIFNLAHLSQNHPLEKLSGGEKTRLWLTKVFSSDANFILLDEPTNHLDIVGREQLYDTIQQWTGGMIVASHDRALLNLMEQMVELSTLGAKIYGGNYDDYAQQKCIEKKAAEQMIQARAEILDKSKELAQTRRERHEQNEAKGNRAKKAQIQAKGSYDKLAMKSAKGRSERTNRRIRIQAERKIDLVESQLFSAKEKLEVVDDIHIDLPKTHVPNGKIILDIHQLNFAFPNSSSSIIHLFDLQLIGPERIALIGANGSGKTTLVKLILNELTPQSGRITLGTDRICYLDQQTHQLNPDLSILENFMQLNPDCNENEAYMNLAKFLFKNTFARKIVKNLSGGERLRALLACVLMSKNPPQLMILDEPTNHLDLNSIENIESALKNYQGAMIVISHDAKFLDNIKIGRKIYAPYATDRK
jgi:ATPase subunit of ABC transporter with duplicated ATPase domains